MSKKTKKVNSNKPSLKKNVEKAVKKPELSAKELIKSLRDIRLDIVLNILLGGEMVVADMIELFKIEPTLLSHHLRVLRENGIIIDTRRSKNVFYKINPDVKVRGKKLGVTAGGITVTFNQEK